MQLHALRTNLQYEHSVLGSERLSAPTVSPLTLTRAGGTRGPRWLLSHHGRRRYTFSFAPRVVFLCPGTMRASRYLFTYKLARCREHARQLTT
jgi:hypothetical protein